MTSLNIDPLTGMLLITTRKGLWPGNNGDGRRSKINESVNWGFSYVIGAFHSATKNGYVKQ